MKPFFISALLLFLFVQKLLFGDSVIDLGQNHDHIGQYLSVYEDPTADMTLENITALPQEVFRPLNKEVDSHLFTTSAYWYRFNVSNSSTDPLSRLIVFNIPWLDVIHITVISPDGNRSYSEGGDTYPYAVRTVKSNLSNFEHSFAPGVSTVYIQIKTLDPFVVPIAIMDRMAFLEHIAHKGIYTAFIYGILGAMILYNLFLFLTIRTRYYAFYVLYVGLFIVMNSSYQCYTFEWLFFDHPTLQNWAESTNIYLFSISGLLFTQSFLNLKNNFPRLYQWTNRIIFFYVFTMASLFFVGYHYHVIFSIIFALLFSIYALSIGMYAFLNGHRFALYFLLGTSAGLSGTLLTSLTVMAILPYNEILYHAIDYGMVADAVLLSLALAEKVKTIQKEKIIALTEANTDALTGLLNRRAYERITESEINRAKRYNGTLSLILMDIDYFKNVNDTYGHAGGDAVLKAVASTLARTTRSYDYLFRFGGEEFVLLLPETDIAMALTHARRIRSDIEELTVNFQNNQIRVTVSIGISQYENDYTEINTMFQIADDRLYRAKEKGRNRIVWEG